MHGSKLRHDAQPRLLAARVDGTDGAAEVGREAGSEHEAGIAQVRIGHDPFAHAGHGFVERRKDQAIGEQREVGAVIARRALHGLAAHPRIETLPGLLAELLRLD